jgi:type II secretory pathway pseudopilin PulG
MRFRPTSSHLPAGKRRQAGFTLAEALAALVFLAIVIPVAVRGLQVANLAGEVALRKAIAARLADRLLNELVVTGQWQQSSQGVVEEGNKRFSWRLRNQTWEKDVLKLLTLQVTYLVQGVEYDVRLSTVVDTTHQ